jgi:hypothetical protein
MAMIAHLVVPAQDCQSICWNHDITIVNRSVFEADDSRQEVERMMEAVIPHAQASRVEGAARAPLLLAGLALLVVAISLGVSSLTLLKLGINYGEAGGSLAAKIHPATYLLAVALVTRIILQRHPARFLIEAGASHRGTMIFMWIVASLLAYAAVNLHVPLSSLIDTFIFPIMALLLLDGIDERNARLLAFLIHAIFAANAILALVEMASGWRLTPVIALGVDLSVADKRSSALFGHPLGNAMLTGLYVTVLSVGGGRDLPSWMRPMALGLQLAAMVSFGGRLATVTMLGLLVLATLRTAMRVLSGQRFRISTAASVLGLLPLVIVALLGIYATGFFDQLIGRFVSDNRSAEARVVMFELIPRFPLFQLLFGPDQDLLNSLKWTEGIEFGIESFWVSFVLTYGAVPSLLFFFGFGAFCLDLARHSGKGAAWAIAYFLIVASGSLSIGDKTLAFGALVILAMILLRAPMSRRSQLPWPRRDGAPEPAMRPEIRD